MASSFAALILPRAFLPILSNASYLNSGIGICFYEKYAGRQRIEATLPLSHHEKNVPTHFKASINP